MEVDISPPRPAFFNEGKSIKSSKSNPPSIRSFSMKGKISFISGLLSKSSSKANIRETTPNLPPVEQPLSEKVQDQNIIPTAINENSTQPIARKNTTRRSTERLNRSTTLAKRLSTSLRRSSSPHSANRVPLPSASSRQLREAALRERGLLPQKDMSALEREQDERISPVFPVPQTISTDGMSEADRIKQQWAKMQSESTEVPDPPPKAEDQLAASEPLLLELDTVQEVVTPLPSPGESAVSSPTLRKHSSRSNLAAPKPPPTIDLPPTPSNPETIPLPPSPFDETFSMYSSELSPRIIPLPPSPSPPPSPRLTGISDPEALDVSFSSLSPRLNLSLSSAPPANSPINSPIASPNSPSAYECSDDGALAPPKSRSRSRSRAALGSSDSEDEAGSIAPPSLAASSQLTLESSFSHSTHKTKPNPLVKTWTNEPKVPVIVESPIEGRSIEQYELVIPTNTIPEDESKESPAPASPASPLIPRGRTLNTAAETDSKRKTIFGRRNTTANTDGSSSPKFGAFASLRRSVVGTLSRGGHSPKVDVTNIPPSPTVPSMSSSTSGRRKGPPPGVRTDVPAAGSGPRSPRLAVSPTMHSHGEIWAKTNIIEDDETRRMTEMAFLG